MHTYVCLHQDREGAVDDFAAGGLSCGLQNAGSSVSTGDVDAGMPAGPAEGEGYAVDDFAGSSMCAALRHAGASALAGDSEEGMPPGEAANCDDVVDDFA